LFSNKNEVQQISFSMSSYKENSSPGERRKNLRKFIIIMFFFFFFFSSSYQTMATKFDTETPYLAQVCTQKRKKKRTYRINNKSAAIDTPVKLRRDFLHAELQLQTSLEKPKPRRSGKRNAQTQSAEI